MPMAGRDRCIIILYYIMKNKNHLPCWQLKALKGETWIELCPPKGWKLQQKWLQKGYRINDPGPFWFFGLFSESTWGFSPSGRLHIRVHLVSNFSRRDIFWTLHFRIFKIVVNTFLNTGPPKCNDNFTYHVSPLWISNDSSWRCDGQCWESLEVLNRSGPTI